MPEEEWTPIERAEVKVRGIDPEFSGLLRVEVALTPSPPAPWRTYFERPSGVSMSLSMHPPRLIGSMVEIRPPDNELEKYLENVDERIRHANERYGAEALPAIQAQAERDAAFRAESQRRVDDAQRRANGLDS
jgi:hypothetical protein